MNNEEKTTKEKKLEIELEKFRKQLTEAWFEIMTLRQENYKQRIQLRFWKKHWSEVIEANVKLANKIKSFDSMYFERLEGVVEEGKDDYKGVQV